MATTRHFAVRALLLCALAATALGASQRSDAEFHRFLDRMRAAAGPVWASHFVSISRLEVNGTTTVVSSDGQGLPFVLRRCDGQLCSGTYFDGTRLYAVDMNDVALPESGRPEPYLRSLRLIASLGFLGPSFESGGGRLIDDGSASLDGAIYRTLLMADRDAIPLRLYVDPQTALLRYARDLHGEDTFEYRDYRRIDGFELPFVILHNGTLLERYDDRTAVAAAFHPPQGPQPSFAGPPAAIATDPAHVTPVFDCALGGIAVKCLLDSGNSGLSVSSELAARLDAPVIGTFQVAGGLGGYSTQVVRAGPLQVGNARFPEANYVVLSDVSHYGYDVVLGADVLAETIVELNPRSHTLRFDAAPANWPISLPLSFQHFVPVVSVQLGSVDAKLAIDTGDESNINLSYDFYEKHPTLFTATERRLVAGVGGSSVQLIGQIPDVTIGTYKTGPQAIGTTQTLQGTAFGHLGAAFLSQFDVQLDYMAAELHLLPL
ncbi:MAG TPA: aspartyl protease family protein [Candidatus Acidoferrales bacterium]|nr:aspartyl protease family protein [Candidatus Acidoferrales bacterium]